MRNLRTVTLTGVDEKTDLDRLEMLQRDYPFAEWGILLSLSRTGQEPRFPSIQRIEQISRRRLRTSVHLCGMLARNFAGEIGFPVEMALTLCPRLERVQINLGRQIDEFPALYRTAWDKSRERKLDMILQAYGFDSPTVRNAAGFKSPHVAFLHDASGGRGIEGDFERPIVGGASGFAGGIHPGNVESKLQAIEALDFSAPFWIDAETGVRTDDWFDLDKAESILRAAKPFVCWGR